MNKKDKDRINQIIEKMKNNEKIYTFDYFPILGYVIVDAHLISINLSKDNCYFGIEDKLNFMGNNLHYTNIYFENELDELRKKIYKQDLNKLEEIIPIKKEELKYLQNKYKELKNKYKELEINNIKE